MFFPNLDEDSELFETNPFLHNPFNPYNNMDEEEENKDYSNLVYKIDYKASAVPQQEFGITLETSNPNNNPKSVQISKESENDNLLLVKKYEEVKIEPPENMTKKIFICRKRENEYQFPEKRFDGAISYIKSKISKYAYHKLNNFCKNIKELEIGKIYLPNSHQFTSITKPKTNYDFLPMKIHEVFTLGKHEHEKQKQNFENFNKIKDFFKSYTINSSFLKELNTFLELTYEDLIKEFYHSKQFEELKNSPKTQFHDKTIFEQENISILEENGFIELIKKKAFE